MRSPWSLGRFRHGSRIHAALIKLGPMSSEQIKDSIADRRINSTLRQMCLLGALRMAGPRGTAYADRVYVAVPNPFYATDPQVGRYETWISRLGLAPHPMMHALVNGYRVMRSRQFAESEAIQ